MWHVLSRGIFAVGFASSIAVPALADTPPDFELGIVVATLPSTPAQAYIYIRSLPKSEQQALITACDDYMKQPAHDPMAGPISFCYALSAIDTGPPLRASKPK